MVWFETQLYIMKQTHVDTRTHNTHTHTHSHCFRIALMMSFGCYLVEWKRIVVASNVFKFKYVYECADDTKLNYDLIIESRPNRTESTDLT